MAQYQNKHHLVRKDQQAIVPNSVFPMGKYGKQMIFIRSVLRKDHGQNDGQKGKEHRNGKRRGQKPPKNMLYYLGWAQSNLEWQIVVVFLVKVFNRFKGLHGRNRGHVAQIGLGFHVLYAPSLDGIEIFGLSLGVNPFPSP